MKKAKILAVCLCAALSLSVFAGCQASEEPSDSNSQPSSFESSKPEPVINPLTGEDGFSPDAVGQRPVAVMVSNIKDSLLNGVSVKQISFTKRLPRAVLPV